MKQKIIKSCRLGDTEITISFHGPIGNKTQAITKKIVVEDAIAKAAQSVARSIKSLTDEQVQKEIQPLVDKMVEALRRV